MTTIIVPAEVFDRIEVELIRSGLGHRLGTDKIDLTDVSIARGEHSGMTQPRPRRRGNLRG